MEIKFGKIIKKRFSKNFVGDLILYEENENTNITLEKKIAFDLKINQLESIIGFYEIVFTVKRNMFNKNCNCHRTKIKNFFYNLPLDRNFDEEIENIKKVEDLKVFIIMFYFEINDYLKQFTTY